ncbi:MAG: hypothetical protein PHP92_04945 [Candidatus Nanoarchaeia archaeon]|nr:hypothetical protein [Candidatus Nanoarchaeia archaeon]
MDYKLEDIVVTTTESDISITPVSNYINKSLFIINRGTNAVTIRVYGSPTGATVQLYTSSKTGVSLYTTAEINLHYRILATLVVNANDNACVDLSDYIYNYFKITGQTGAGTSTINYAVQGVRYGL